jgi:hypothetical protein
MMMMMTTTTTLALLIAVQLRYGDVHMFMFTRIFLSCRYWFVGRPRVGKFSFLLFCHFTVAFKVVLLPYAEFRSQECLELYPLPPPSPQYAIMVLSLDKGRDKFTFFWFVANIWRVYHYIVDHNLTTSRYLFQILFNLTHIMAEVLKFVFYVWLFSCFGRDTLFVEGWCDISEFLYSNSVNRKLLCVLTSSYLWCGDALFGSFLPPFRWTLCLHFLFLIT